MKQSLFFVLPAAESGLQASSPFAMSESRPALASEREERETPREDEGALEVLERGEGGGGGSGREDRDRKAKPDNTMKSIEEVWLSCKQRRGR